MPEPNPLSNWPSFADAVRERLEAGRAAYRDTSFARPPVELGGEIEQELLDVCAWSFILWARVRELCKRLEQAGCKVTRNRKRIRKDKRT